MDRDNMSNSIKVYLKNKKKIYPFNQGEFGLYCWEFKSDLLEPNYFYYKTKQNLYRIFFDKDGFWIGRLVSDQFINSYFTVEKIIGAIYCETPKGRFYWE